MVKESSPENSIHPISHPSSNSKDFGDEEL
jgi:hypothetical protein